MDPFPNHIATVEDYLRCYKTSPDKLRFFYCFTQYIVARAWKKMHRRIFSPYSLGYIYSLTKVGGTQLRAKFLAHSPSIPTPKGNDTKLASLLVGMQEEGQISSLIMDSCPSKEFRSQLTSLLSAFADVLKKKENKELSGVPEGTGVYTEATCYEFHQLLVASLMAYANALGELCDAGNAKTMEAREHCMEKVWKCTCLLWRIAYSQIFHQHVVLLARSLWLEPELPQEDAKRMAAALGLRPGTNDPIQVDGDEDDMNGDLPEDMNGDLPEDMNGDLPEDMDEADDGQVAECVTLFKRWVRLQVGYWVALQIVSLFSDDLESDQFLKDQISMDQFPKLHLLAVEPLNDNKATMEHWMTTVKKLATWQSTPQPSTSDSARVTQGFNSDIIIGNIQAQIIEYTKIGDVDNIFHAFNHENPLFYGSDHCEVIVSALAKYVDALLDDSTPYNRHLKTILKVRAAYMNIIFINPTSYTALEHTYHCSVKAVLSSMLGTTGDSERRRE
jgi:hypothetical protein